MKSKIFVTYHISFIAGIFFAPYIQYQKEPLLNIAFALIIMIPFLFRVKILKHFLIISVIFLLAVLHYQAKIPQDKEGYTSYYIEEKIVIYGYVISEPTGDKVSNFYFKPVTIFIDDEEIEKPKGNVAVVLKEKRVSLGDFFYLEGNLEKIEGMNFHKRFGVFSKITFPEKEEAEGYFENSIEEKWIDIRKTLVLIKNKFVISVEKIYPEPDSSLILGLLLGIKKTMPDWLRESFNRTGTTHIVALSGFNITIIIVILRNLTKGLSRKLSFYIPVFFVFLFVVMTGGEASVVRASLMGLTILLAKKIGRQDDPKISIAFSGCLMIYLNPFILTGDIGFLLSFTSMLGMIYLAPIISKMFYFLSENIRENLAVTLAAQAFAAPIIIYYFKEFSLISPISNIFVLPAVPLAMFFSFVAVLVHFIFAPLSAIFGWIGYLLTRYIIKSVEIFSSFSFASFNIEVANPYVFMGYYMILISLIIYFNKKNAEKTR